MEEQSNAINIMHSDVVYKEMKDPKMLSRYYKMNAIKIEGRNAIYGDSPTDLFIGRFGWPNVTIGPLVPNAFGDTTIFSAPEMWRSFTIPKIFEMRLSLVRGMYKTNVSSVEKGKVEQMVRDLALSDKPATSQIEFSKSLSTPRKLDDEISPFGPSGFLKSFELDNTRAERHLQMAYSDTDLLASDAIFELYNKGTSISKIQKGLSAGLFGRGERRVFVPTRWSITAVDDTISKANLKQIKEFDNIDCIKAYYNVALDNRWLIFLLPSMWEYESIEAWYPKTTWNDTDNIAIFGSYEPYKGRSKYAEIGGCYYSGRLAVTEELRRQKKQGAALILREVHSGYTAPVGVWNVREHVRETFEKDPITVNGVGDMIKIIKEKLEIPLFNWVKSSSILSRLIRQKTLIA